MIHPLQSFTQTIEMEHTFAIVRRPGKPGKDRADFNVPSDAGGQVSDRSQNSEPVVKF